MAPVLPFGKEIGRIRDAIDLGDKIRLGRGLRTFFAELVMSYSDWLAFAYRGLPRIYNHAVTGGTTYIGLTKYTNGTEPIVCVPPIGRNGAGRGVTACATKRACFSSGRQTGRRCFGRPRILAVVSALPLS